VVKALLQGPDLRLKNDMGENLAKDQKKRKPVALQVPAQAQPAYTTMETGVIGAVHNTVVDLSTKDMLSGSEPRLKVRVVMTLQ